LLNLDTYSEAVTTGSLEPITSASSAGEAAINRVIARSTGASTSTSTKSKVGTVVSGAERGRVIQNNYYSTKSLSSSEIKSINKQASRDAANAFNMAGG